MKLTQNIRSFIVVASLALIGALTTLPLAIDTLRNHDAPTRTHGTPTVKLICFDREMRANDCDVSLNAALAAK
jgi:hypothetical protein